jgi:hypothetical protein
MSRLAISTSRKARCTWWSLSVKPERFHPQFVQFQNLAATDGSIWADLACR